MKVSNILDTRKKSEKFAATLEDSGHKLEILSSDRSRQMVRLKIGEIDVLVDARELQAAIKNATNIGRL